MMNLVLDPDVYNDSKILFNLFRRELAIAAEIITPDSYFGTPDDGIDWQYISKATDFFGYWKEEPKDPIWYLLAHSDTIGVISNKHLKKLNDRLTELNSKLPGKNLYPNWQEFTKDFNKKLQIAYLEEKDIIFK